MPQVVLPFRAVPVKDGHNHEHSAECGLMQLLPAPVQTVCRQNTHLLDYLHAVPVQDIGIPQYVPQLTRKMADLAIRNLIYPVSEDVFIHIWSGAGEERDLYVPVEPCMAVALNGKLKQVEDQLLEMAADFENIDTEEERRGTLMAALEEICQMKDGNPANRNQKKKSQTKGIKRVPVNTREFAAIRYIMMRDKVGMGALHPMVLDKNIEDISCSGLGNIFIEHKIFSGMKCAICFETDEELDQFVLRLSEHIRKPVTIRNPIVDAVLQDGSRINIVYGKEISNRGSNFTIRKFMDTPLSILELVGFGSMDYSMAAYLSLVLEDGMNTFVAGETASGKTTLLNAITVFIPPAHKVVSIEDTPELQVPHKNWIREVSKPGRKGEQGAEVSMFDLLKAALRQRPNVIVVGEIRGEEGATAFQAMQTGHTVMATFHAASVEKLIQRLTGNPINIPKTYMDNLNVVVIQSAVKLPNGKKGRRAMSISEIVGYDSSSDSFSYIEIFRWDPVKDVFEFTGDKNSYLLEQKIAPKKGIPPNRKWEIYNLLEKRAKILRKLHKEKGITDFYELLGVISRAQKEGIF